MFCVCIKAPETVVKVALFTLQGPRNGSYFSIHSLTHLQRTVVASRAMQKSFSCFALNKFQIWLSHVPVMQNKGTKPNPASFVAAVGRRRNRMEKAFPCILLLLSWSSASTKYVRVNEKMSWLEAQTYCRQNHADLAHVNNNNDNRRLQEKNPDHDWFGLWRDHTASGKWRWSGGGKVSVFFWAGDQPQRRSGENFGMLLGNGWHDSQATNNEKFLCFSPVLVKTRMTWEDALGYCRQHHGDLASLVSETDMMLVGKALARAQITGPVWVGLHFFSGEWLWVDGETSGYQGWGQDGEPACPHHRQVCAALRMKPNATTAPPVDENPASAESFGNIHEGVLNEWEAHDCDNRLPFVCY